MDQMDKANETAKVYQDQSAQKDRQLEETLKFIEELKKPVAKESKATQTVQFSKFIEKLQQEASQMQSSSKQLSGDQNTEEPLFDVEDLASKSTSVSTAAKKRLRQKRKQKGKNGIDAV